MADPVRGTSARVSFLHGDHDDLIEASQGKAKTKTDKKVEKVSVHEIKNICIPRPNRALKVAIVSGLLTVTVGLGTFTAVKALMAASCTIAAATGIGAVFMLFAVIIVAGIILMVNNYRRAGKEAKMNKTMQSENAQLTLENAQLKQQIKDQATKAASESSPGNQNQPRKLFGRR